MKYLIKIILKEEMMLKLYKAIFLMARRALTPSATLNYEIMLHEKKIQTHHTR
jgi:hypothetical protein